jgi:hypothetical protein
MGEGATREGGRLRVRGLVEDEDADLEWSFVVGEGVGEGIERREGLEVEGLAGVVGREAIVLKLEVELLVLNFWCLSKCTVRINVKTKRQREREKEREKERKRNE